MRRDLTKISYRAWLLGAFLVVLTIGMINPVKPLDMVLEHVPTVVVLALLVHHGRRTPLANSSYTLLFFFLTLHVIGAHYPYSNVPYEEWSRAAFGHGVNEAFGWERNHYDRLVHFLFGVLVCPVAADMGERFGFVKRGFWSALFGIGVISICGNVYEVIEWVISLVALPADAENYNGQQGDTFDPVKDLALNFGGALISGIGVLASARMDRPAPREGVAGSIGVMRGRGTTIGA